jgi:cytochrome c peroxidase
MFKNKYSPSIFWSGLGIGVLGLSLACGSSGTTTLSESEISLESLVLSAPSASVSSQPLQRLDYINYALTSLPAHFFKETGGFLNASPRDNTPIDNAISNEGAVLGRVLFYDKALSRNQSVSCGSCHHQNMGFSDAARFSLGFDGERTTRHSPGLSQARFYENGKFFWDERAASLEEQVLQPIQNEIEMGMTLEEVIARLQTKPFYGRLFNSAFGSPEITTDGISKAMAQFIRSMVSYQSKFDRAFDSAGEPRFSEILTEEEQLGLALFQGQASTAGVGINCSFCHGTTAITTRDIQNIGLPNNSDEGAGEGKFKAPSLRNVGVRRSFMHDGRFSNLREVVDHYSNNIADIPNLSIGLRDDNGQVKRPNYNREERDALLAFLNILTDPAFLNSPLFADPFRREGERPENTTPPARADQNPPPRDGRR